MKRASWLNLLVNSESGAPSPSAKVRELLSRLDEELFELWNLGENVLLAWTFGDHELRFLKVRHYTIAEAIHRVADDENGRGHTPGLVNEVLAGPKYVPAVAFQQLCRLFRSEPHVIRMDLGTGAEAGVELIEHLVRRYGVSLVRGRAVVLLDAVQFSLASPLEQVAMLNSLAYSVNSAYRQLLSKDIQVNFARTTTGDGFYIWNRARTVDANVALYKLMMMILADNAIAQRKARGAWVPKLRAAFHVGEHYEFYQVEALNPTTFSYIVGQVTIDLSRMIAKALPGQILLGDFGIEVGDGTVGPAVRYDTLDFVEKTAVSLDQLHGLEVAGDRIGQIRCYLTGQRVSGERYPVNRYHIRDKHGTERTVYNAKINIHRENAEPIFLGVRSEELADFPTEWIEIMDRAPVAAAGQA
ncbi:MAG: hypothetical protein HYY78_22805 [Betaproteobacteria bacterium]|nr:hypothetical protein [Betaproteobacteria bacterium]